MNSRERRLLESREQFARSLEDEELLVAITIAEGKRSGYSPDGHTPGHIRRDPAMIQVFMTELDRRTRS